VDRAPELHLVTSGGLPRSLPANLTSWAADYKRTVEWAGE
jgi:hypothetical protein